MSETSTNWYQAYQMADDGGVGIGRGTGCTLKEFNRALDECMRRHGLESHQWKTKAQVEAERAALPIADCRLPIEKPLRVKTTVSVRTRGFTGVCTFWGQL